jgi:hypothetical protein
VAEPDVIAEYVDRLARQLAFDPALAERVRREAEDHLWEDVAAHPAGVGREAERRAVERFGNPEALAAQLAVGSLARQARGVGVVTICGIAAVFVAMKARLTWYVATEYASGQGGRLAGIVVSIDRYAFWLAIVVAIGGWVYIGTRRVPPALTSEYRRQIRRFAIVCLAGAGALITSVIGDGVLTSLRLGGSRGSLDVLILVVSMAIEVACAGALVRSIRGMAQRATATGRVAPLE